MSRCACPPDRFGRHRCCPGRYDLARVGESGRLRCERPVGHADSHEHGTLFEGRHVQLERIRW